MRKDLELREHSGCNGETPLLAWRTSRAPRVNGLRDFMMVQWVDDEMCGVGLEMDSKWSSIFGLRKSCLQLCINNRRFRGEANLAGLTARS